MAANSNKYIFFVDDEPKIREVISQTLQMPGVDVVCFAGAGECLEQISFRRCDLLVTDLKMPVMNGLELLKQVKSIAPWIPVLLVTGYGDIPSAVAAIKAGASDFIEKPLSKETLLRKVNMLLGENCRQNSYLGKPLTLNEQKILKMITGGKSSKEIASILHRSLRTIEVHRSRIMSKFGAENLVDLLKRAALMGIVELPEKQDLNLTTND